MATKHGVGVMENEEQKTKPHIALICKARQRKTMALTS